MVEAYGEPCARDERDPHRPLRDRAAVLHEDTWYSSYRSEPKVVRVGTKPKPAKAEPKPTPTPEPTPDRRPADAPAADAPPPTPPPPTTPQP